LVVQIIKSEFVQKLIFHPKARKKLISDYRNRNSHKYFRKSNTRKMVEKSGWCESVEFALN